MKYFFTTFLFLLCTFRTLTQTPWSVRHKIDLIQEMMIGDSNNVIILRPPSEFIDGNLYYLINLRNYCGNDPITKVIVKRHRDELFQAVQSFAFADSNRKYRDVDLRFYCGNELLLDYFKRTPYKDTVKTAYERMATVGEIMPFAGDSFIGDTVQALLWEIPDLTPAHNTNQYVIDFAKIIRRYVLQGQKLPITIWYADNHKFFRFYFMEDGEAYDDRSFDNVKPEVIEKKPAFLKDWGVYRSGKW